MKLDSLIRADNRIEISHRQNVFTFRFAALDFTAPGKNRYQYRMKGFDETWISTQSGSATFTNLDPGEYVFQVKGSNSSGIWNPVPTEVNIYVQPPFWETTNFKIAASLLFLLLLLSAHFYRISRIRKSKLELEAIVARKTRELSQKNQELLQINRDQEKLIQERDTLISELQAALGKIKTLSGLLPICSHCKKIRDDKGYWRSIERYVSEHSEADFSHGICPECAKLLYPEVYDKTRLK